MCLLLIMLYVLFYVREEEGRGGEGKRKRERGRLDERKIVISVMVTRSNLVCNN